MGRRRLPRANSATLAPVTLLQGEVAYDTDLKTLRLGDGTAVGGLPIPMSATDVLISRYGGKGNGSFDNTAAFADAVADLGVAGGRLRIPAGVWSLAGGGIGADGKRTGIFVPPRGDAVAHPFGQVGPIEFLFEPGAVLIPAANDLILARISGQYIRMRGAAFANPAVATGAWAYAIVPPDMTNTDTRYLTNFNSLEDFAIAGFDEGVVLQAGATVGGSSSNCYYNTIHRGEINNTKRGMLVKDGIAASQGANRNRFSYVRVGNAVNTGLEIQSGDTGRVIGCEFEGITSGVSPNATPTAVKISTAGAVSTWENLGWVFTACVAEACTRDLDCGQDDTQFRDCAFAFVSKAVYGQTPHTRTGKAIDSSAYYSHLNTAGFTRHGIGVDLGIGDYFGTYDPTRLPEVTGDFKSINSGPVIRTKATVAGAPEFRLDSPGNYGYLSFFAAGTPAWYMGTLATGPTHCSVVDGDGVTVRAQFRAGGEFRGVGDLGSAGVPWANLFVTNSPTVVSDARLKAWRGGLDETELKIARRVAAGIGVFQWTAALEAGSDAALHVGVKAQDVVAAFEAEGRDALAYQMVSHTSWPEEVEAWDDVHRIVEPEATDPATGEVIKPAVTEVIHPAGRRVTPAGDRYTVVYDQLNLFVLAGHMADTEARLAALEAR